MDINVVMTGKELKAWRQGFGLEQREVALNMGVSPATLCRIEKEDRLITEGQLQRLKNLYANLSPGSPVARSAAKIPEVLESMPKDLPTITSLVDIGKTYQYKECTVTPSASYAVWSNHETKRVNEALERLAEQGRLENGEDFFKLTYEEVKNFISAAKCDLSEIDYRSGVVFITRKTVNTLTHYFNDPKSIAKSRQINTDFTALEELRERPGTTFEKMIIMGDLCYKWAELERQGAILGAQIETISKEIKTTETKAEETKKELEAHMQASRLTGDQIEVIENLLSQKGREFGHVCVRGLIQRHLKNTYLGKRLGTYKDIPCRHYDDMVARIHAWIPTPTDRDSILKHRIKDGKEPAGYGSDASAPLFS